MTDAICLGELLVGFVPTETGKDLIEASSFKRSAGGAPANVAVGLKRFGITSGFMGKVGANPVGRFLTRIGLSAIGRTKLMHFGSISLSAEPARSATLYAADAAREAEVMIHRRQGAGAGKGTTLERANEADNRHQRPRWFHLHHR